MLTILWLSKPVKISLLAVNIFTHSIYWFTFKSFNFLCGQMVRLGKLVFQKNMFRSIEITVGFSLYRSTVFIEIVIAPKIPTPINTAIINLKSIFGQIIHVKLLINICVSSSSEKQVNYSLALKTHTVQPHANPLLWCRWDHEWTLCRIRLR